jgi:hypothetical protein
LFGIMAVLSEWGHAFAIFSFECALVGIFTGIIALRFKSPLKGLL